MNDQRLRVLHVITRLDKGGAPKNTLLTVAGLDKTRYAVTLVSGPSYDPEENLEDMTAGAGVRLIIFPELTREIRPLAELKAVWRLVRHMLKNRYHIVHTHTSKPGVVGRLAAIIALTPILIHASHGHIYTGFYGPFMRAVLLIIDRLLTLGTDVVITLTRRGRDEQHALKIAPWHKFRVVPSGVDLARFKNASVDRQAKAAELGVASGGPLLGMVAELLERKGHTYLVQAMASVAKRFPTARLLLIGQGPLEATLRRQIASLGLEKHIILTGHREDVPEILKMLDVFVLPSINEGMGRVIVEAMAAGLPVAASNLMGIPELVEDGVTGLLTRPAEASDIAEKIIRLLEDPEAARQMGLAGQEKVFPAYDQSVMVQAYNQLYDELARARGLV